MEMPYSTGRLIDISNPAASGFTPDQETRAAGPIKAEALPFRYPPVKSFARALCRLIAAVGGTVFAMTLLVVNPLTRPASLGAATVETGAHLDAVEAGADLLLQQGLSGGEPAESDDRRGSLTPDQHDRLRSVLLDAFPDEWLASTIAAVAEDAEVWVTGSERPPVTIDLTEPKERIRGHPDSPLLAMVLSEADEDTETQSDGADPRSMDAAVNEMLADIPDEVALHQAGWWEDVITRASDLRQGTLQVGLIAALIALLTAAGGVALNRAPIAPALASWSAWLALSVALPVLGLTWVVPAVAGAIPFPDVFALPIRIVEGTWHTSRLLGWISLATALCLWGLTHVLREHALVHPEPESGGKPGRALARLGGETAQAPSK